MLVEKCISERIRGRSGKPAEKNSGERSPLPPRKIYAVQLIKIKYNWIFVAQKQNIGCPPALLFCAAAL